MFRWMGSPLPAAAAALAFIGVLGAVGSDVPASDQPSLPPARDHRLLAVAAVTHTVTPIATLTPTPIVTPRTPSDADVYAGANTDTPAHPFPPSRTDSYGASAQPWAIVGHVLHRAPL